MLDMRQWISFAPLENPQDDLNQRRRTPMSFPPFGDQGMAGDSPQADAKPSRQY
jgi:hypothetical protein